MPLARMRPMTSAGPPAAKGTVSVTGLDGNSCAAAFPTTAQASHNRLDIRYIELPLTFLCSDFFRGVHRKQRPKCASRKSGEEDSKVCLARQIRRASCSWRHDRGAVHCGEPTNFLGAGDRKQQLGRFVNLRQLIILRRASLTAATAPAREMPPRASRPRTSGRTAAAHRRRL